jgi:long-chain acyl-CoA synthetase
VRILLTGATGSFGRYLAREFAGRGCRLVLLARGADAEQRVRRVVGALPQTTVLRSDVAEKGLGLSRMSLRSLRTVDAVVHAAATTEFGLPLEVSRAINVEGTRIVLDVAAGLPRLERFAYVGTAFVAGERTGRILETELAHDAGFVTTYERSKHEAEQLVRGSDVPATIFRPSIVVERRDEPQPRPSGLRFTLALMRAGLLPALPCPRGAGVDLIGAEDAAHAIATIFLAAGASGTFHVASGDEAPGIDEVVAAAGAPPVRHLGREAFRAELETLRERNPRAARHYDALATFVEILSYAKIFDTSMAEAVLGGAVRRSDPLDEIRPRRKAA